MRGCLVPGDQCDDVGALLLQDLRNVVRMIDFTARGRIHEASGRTVRDNLNIRTC
jgi:hypothetical protein